jgi:hypothetical protein
VRRRPAAGCGPEQLPRIRCSAPPDSEERGAGRAAGPHDPSPAVGGRPPGEAMLLNLRPAGLTRIALQEPAGGGLSVRVTGPAASRSSAGYQRTAVRDRRTWARFYRPAPKRARRTPRPRHRCGGCGSRARGPRTARRSGRGRAARPRPPGGAGCGGTCGGVGGGGRAGRSGRRGSHVKTRDSLPPTRTLRHERGREKGTRASGCWRGARCP